MKKLLLLSSLLTIICVSAFAQSSSESSNIRISFGPEIGQPLGQANKIYDLVYGGSIKIEAPISSSGLNLVFSGGYDIFKTYGYLSDYIGDGKYIPLEAGLKFYPNNSIVFIEGDLGASFNDNDNYSGPKTAFVYAPAIGVSLAKNQLDITARYEGRVETGGTVSQLALRIALKLGGK